MKSSLCKNKKAQELSYIVFLVIFITLFSILGMILKTSIEEETNSNSVWNTITTFISDIPVIGQFWDFLTASRNFLYLHPYLGIVYIAFFGVPVGYIILKLIRGGG